MFEPSLKRAKFEGGDPPVHVVASHLDAPSVCAPPVMNEQEAMAITVSFDEAATKLVPLMRDKGVAIVTGVLMAEDIKRLEQALKDDMEELVDLEAVAGSVLNVQDAWANVCSKGMHAWPAASLADVGGRGRFQDRGLPHGRFAWQARTHPRVMQAYAILHGSDDLISSCDNAFVANATQAEETENKCWPHVDQNDHDTRVPCKDWDVYQGILYVWDSTESNHRSTTVVWPGSHKRYKEYMEDPNVARRIREGKPHFTLISGMEPSDRRDRLIQGWQAEARRVPVPSGALLLFTSRTTHQGWSGGPRLAQPVCWEPRGRQDALMRERKLRLAALGLPSTHWASLALPHELSDLRRPVSVSSHGNTNPELVRFPLCASIQSQVLTKDADSDALWQHLTSPDWFSSLPADLAQLLENSIADEYKKWL